MKFGHYLCAGIDPLGDTPNYFTMQPAVGFRNEGGHQNFIPRKPDQDVYKAPIMNEAIRMKTGEKVLGLKNAFDTRKTVQEPPEPLGGVAARIESRDTQHPMTTYKPKVVPPLKQSDNHFAGMNSKSPCQSKKSVVNITNMNTRKPFSSSVTSNIAPYYFRAMLSENISTSNQLTNMTITNWVTTLPFPYMYDINNKDLINNEEWVCPSDGIYAVNCRLEMYAGNDFLKLAKVRLNKQEFLSYYVVSEGTFVVSIADSTDVAVLHPTFYDLIPMKSGEKLKVTYEYASRNWGVLQLFSSPTSIWTITKIS